MPHGGSHMHVDEGWLEAITDWGNQHDSVGETGYEIHTPDYFD